LAETPVESSGRVFRLGDIATVTHGYVDPPSFVVRQEGKPAIGIGVVTAKGANILELGKEVEKATAEFMKAVPQGIDLKMIADQPKVVEHAVGEFVHSFMEALVIVLFVSFLGMETPHLQRGALDLYPNRRHHAKPGPRLDPTRPF
jgi:multidrug efflux pump